ncbi:hypothetical protein JNJ66_06625 [Candidatus Saccharibacteria bacterium]|nr:hypothetical protein [Candidatus Saccharibacteria bacterium]
MTVLANFWFQTVLLGLVGPGVVTFLAIRTLGIHPARASLKVLVLLLTAVAVALQVPFLGFYLSEWPADAALLLLWYIIYGILALTAVVVWQVRRHRREERRLRPISRGK